MTIYLIRHGAAEQASDSGNDADRRLTEKGTLRIALVAKGLSRLGVEFDRIISSPYIRARQTAEIISRIVNDGEAPRLENRLTPHAHPIDLDELVKENADVEYLAIVGHQPNLGNFLGALCAAGELDVDIKKGSVTAVGITHFRPRMQGRLLWHLPAKLLERVVG